MKEETYDLKIDPDIYDYLKELKLALWDSLESEEMKHLLNNLDANNKTEKENFQGKIRRLRYNIRHNKEKVSEASMKQIIDKIGKKRFIIVDRDDEVYIKKRVE
jgi:DNA-binding MurR/RpiR family transcriptional regulator